jgi:hypothetical protein
MLPRLSTFAIAVLLGMVAFSVADYAHRRIPHASPLEELAYYPSGRHLRPATLGHSESAADLAWIRAVQYYGEHRRSDNHFTRMEHVFDILTTLSPRFVTAYVFGGFALAQEGQDFDAGERLILKGLDANPKSGELAFRLGFMHYVRPGGRDLAKAAEYFEIASKCPDAPAQAARFAAYSRQNSGHLAVSYELWMSILRTSSNPYMREVAEREAKALEEAMRTGRTEGVIHRLGTPQVLLGP